MTPIAFWKRRLRASTLVEVTTALIIISMIFTVAIVIYLNVQKAGVSSLKLSCYAMIDEVYGNTVASGRYDNREVSYGDVIVYQVVQKHSQSEDLVMVRLEARNIDNKLLAERKHLAYVPDQH